MKIIKGYEEQKANAYLKVPKCEIFDPFFYTNKSYMGRCAADFSLLNLPKGKSLGRSKPATNS